MDTLLRFVQPTTNSADSKSPQLYSGLIPKLCLIAYSDPLVERVRQRYPHLAIEHTVIFPGRIMPYKVHLIQPHEGKEFGLVSPQCGSSNAAMTLEGLIDLGFEDFVSIGIAGHPTFKDVPDLTPGDIVLVRDALGGYEGVTAFNFPEKEIFEANSVMTEMLGKILDSKGIQYLEGRAATIALLYRETPYFIRTVLSRDALAMEMELSALFAIAAYRRKRMAAMVIVSDVEIIKENGEGRLGIDFLSPDIPKTEDKLFEVVMELANKL